MATGINAFLPLLASTISVPSKFNFVYNMPIKKSSMISDNHFSTRPKFVYQTLFAIWNRLVVCFRTSCRSSSFYYLGTHDLIMSCLVLSCPVFMLRFLRDFFLNLTLAQQKLIFISCTILSV